MKKREIQPQVRLKMMKPSNNHLIIGDTFLETQNITFDSMEEMPRLELRNGSCLWNCGLTALRFKTAGTKYRFIFSPQKKH